MVCPVICPVLAPEEHTVKPELISVLGRLKVRMDGCGRTIRMGARTPWSGLPRCGSVERLAPGSIGGKHWITVVRQDPKETYRAAGGTRGESAALWAWLSWPCLWGTGVLVARRIARPIQLLHDGVQEIGSGRLERRLGTQDRG